jgi:hypothetical protein
MAMPSIGFATVFVGSGFFAAFFFFVVAFFLAGAFFFAAGFFFSGIGIFMPGMFICAVAGAASASALAAANNIVFTRVFS